MRIALDVRPSLSKPTGVGAYVLALAQRLPLILPEAEFVYFSASLRERYESLAWPRNARLVDRHIPVRALNYAWNRLGWPPVDSLVGGQIDLSHSPHPLIVPTRKGKSIVTIHDLFFYKHPDMTRAEIRRDYVPLVRDHVRKADGIICVSGYTAAETRLLLDVPADRLTVVPNGIDPIFKEPIAESEVEAVLARHKLPRGGILYVGAEERRKNLVTLAMAYMGLARRRSRVPPLILVGPGSYWTQPRIAGPQIRATGYLETREIRALMAASAVLVLVSLEEGFGLPVAEAMAAGLPVVCSRGSALEETAGGAASLVNPMDAESIAKALERVLDDPDHAGDLRARGLARSASFDWERAARETAAVYQRVLGA